MTIQEKKQLVKEAIVRAVPSVMDLKMGCFMKQAGHNCIFIKTIEHIIGGAIYHRDLVLFEGDVNVSERQVVGGEWETIGRPITLADVLVSINKKRMENILDFNDSFRKYTDIDEGNVYNNMLYFLTENWDLSQDFDHQSEETIGFLWSLLCE